MSMTKDPESHSHGRSSTTSPNLASCLLATVFLLLIIAGSTTVFLLFFKPKQPNITVESVQFPTFSLSNGTLTFTFLQRVSVTNPNRDEFTHYDSSLQLVYSGNPVGTVFVPAGNIGGGRTQRMTAKFDLESYLVGVPARGGNGDGYDYGMGMGMGMGIETRMKMVGRVRVLKVFTHRVESECVCRVDVDAIKGSVLNVHC